MNSEGTARQLGGIIDDSGADNPIVQTLSAVGFSGNDMLRELRNHPIIQVVGTSIDFNSDEWVLVAEKITPVTPHERRVRFGNAQDADLWKLFFLCMLIWKRNKPGTCMVALKSAQTTFLRCGGKDALRDTITPDAYRLFVDGMRDKSCGYLYGKAYSLLEFLRFRDNLFNVPVDQELVDEIGRDLRKCTRVMSAADGIPAIDDSYLEQIVNTCIKAISDDKEPHDLQVAAATILLASQVGMRISEVLGMTVDALQISKKYGERDIAYLKFDSYKGARGNSDGKPVEATVGETGLLAFLWLRDNCARDRERHGTDALVVVPKQRGQYLTRPWGSRMFRKFILCHHDSIPCINTQGTYPNMTQLSVARVAKDTGVNLDPLGLTGSETLVYPRFHSFRSTVATKLYEEGVDKHYIQRHMGHISVETTIGYIRSDREIERQNNDLVYRAVLGDGAEFMGKHGSEFQQLVERFVGELPEHVKANLDEVVAAAAKKYPLRRKVGGVCIRCAKMFPCPTNDDTDQIYCAFGVCPNQCVLYFFADQCLDTVRSHMELVEVNRQRGHTKAARNELKKAQNVIRDALVPELDSLDKQLAALGRDGVLKRFPELEQLIDTLPEVRKEITEWQAMSI